MPGKGYELVQIISRNSRIKMSGLEMLRKMIAGEIPPPSISETMGMSVVSASLEKVEFEAIATAICIISR